MEELIYSLNIMLPLFLVGAFGYLLKRLKMIDDSFIDQGLSLCFSFIFPLMVFRKIYTVDLVAGFDAKVFGFGIVSAILCVAAGIGIAYLCTKDNHRRGDIACGMFKSNFVVIGMPIIEGMYGAEASVNIAALTPFLLPIYNIAAVIGYTIFQRDDSGKRISVKETVLNVLKNPFIIAVAAAGAFRLLHIPLPGVALKGLADISAMSTPFALILVGGMFELGEARSNLKDSLLTCLFRLIVFPTIAVVIAVAMGLRGEHLMTALLLIGAPTAISNCSFSRNMGGDYKLAGEITMFTMLLFSVTMCMFIFTLKLTHLI